MIATLGKLTLAAVIAAALPAIAAAQQTTLKVVSFVPKSASYSVSFQRLFADKVNADPKSPFRDEVRVIPLEQSQRP